MKIEVLANGLEAYLQENHSAPVVSVQCLVGVGSQMESASERGMAHFLEHMLFKGTQKRAVGELTAIIEGCGGDINAYTSFDRTVYSLNIESKHLALGIELLLDAVFESVLDPTEFEREKEVILEEIKRSADDPAAQLGYQMFGHFYEGSEVGRPVIGFREQVAAYSRDELFSFYKNWYQPNNMKVVVCGDFESPQALSQINQCAGKIHAKVIPVANTPELAPRCESYFSIKPGDFKLPRVEVAFPIPSVSHADTVALDMVAHLLTGGDSGRFNLSLREELGFVHGVSASVFSRNFPGLFSITFIPATEDWPRVISEIAKELASLAAMAPPTLEELQRARVSQHLLRLERDESIEGQSAGIVGCLSSPYGLGADRVWEAAMEAVSPESAALAVKRWLVPDKAAVFGIHSDQLNIDVPGVASAWAAGFELNREPRTLNSYTKSPVVKGKDLDWATLSPQLKIVYRQSVNTPFFSLCAASLGGLLRESPSQAGLYRAYSQMVTLAYEGCSYEELALKLENMGAHIGAFSGKDSHGLTLKCQASQRQEALELFSDSLVRPEFPDQQWHSLLRETREIVATRDDDPASMAMRLFGEQVFGQHPYGRPSYGSLENIEGWSPQDLLKKWPSVCGRHPWVVAAVGPEPFDQVMDSVVEGLKPWIDSFGPGDSPEVPKSNPMKLMSKRVLKEREQAHLVSGFLGLDWHDPSRPALEVMMSLLGGQGGRLFQNLREKESLAYSVSPLSYFGVHPGLFAGYIGCDPSKVERAQELMNYEFHRLVSETVMDDELQRAKNYVTGQHAMGLQRSDSQAMTMALMEIYGLGAQSFQSFPDEIEKVTSADVIEAARKVIRPDAQATVIVGANPALE